MTIWKPFTRSMNTRIWSPPQSLRVLWWDVENIPLKITQNQLNLLKQEKIALEPIVGNKYRGPNLHLMTIFPGQKREQSDHAISMGIGCWIQEHELNNIRGSNGTQLLRKAELPPVQLQSCIMTKDKFGDAAVFLMHCYGIHAKRTGTFAEAVNFFQFGR